MLLNARPCSGRQRRRCGPTWSDTCDFPDAIGLDGYPGRSGPALRATSPEAVTWRRLIRLSESRRSSRAAAGGGQGWRPAAGAKAADRIDFSTGGGPRAGVEAGGGRQGGGSIDSLTYWPARSPAASTASSCCGPIQCSTSSSAPRACHSVRGGRQVGEHRLNGGRIVRRPLDRDHRGRGPVRGSGRPSPKRRQAAGSPPPAPRRRSAAAARMCSAKHVQASPMRAASRAPAGVSPPMMMRGGGCGTGKACAPRNVKVAALVVDGPAAQAAGAAPPPPPRARCGALCCRREVDAVCLVLAGMPADADAELHAAAREVGHGRRHPRQHRRVTVHDVADEGADAQSDGRHGGGGQRGPALQHRVGQAPAADEVIPRPGRL